MPTSGAPLILTAIVSMLLASNHALAQPASSTLAECAAIAADITLNDWW